MNIKWIPGSDFDFPEGRPHPLLPAYKQRRRREKTTELLFASGWIENENYILPKDPLSVPWSELPERTKEYVRRGSYLNA